MKIRRYERQQPGSRFIWWKLILGSILCFVLIVAWQKGGPQPIKEIAEDLPLPYQAQGSGQ